MRNTLGDLHNHLFAQLERLSDEDIKGDELYDEIERAAAITKISQQIVANGNLVIKAEQLKKENIDKGKKIPSMLEG